MLYKLLQDALLNGQAKEYRDTYLIYPGRFTNLDVLRNLLASLNDDYDFQSVMGTIKASKKIRQVI